MRDGRCPRCGGTAVYAKEHGLDGVLVDGKKVTRHDYVCTTCGFFESYIADRDELDTIVRRAEKLGDWRRIG